MAGEIHFFVSDERQKEAEPLHFDRLYLAIRAYKALPPTSRKVLGVAAEGYSAELARCVPVHPGDEEGEAFAGKDIAVYPSHIQGCITLQFRQFKIGRIDLERRVFTFKRAYLIERDPRMSHSRVGVQN